jgi:hypothetical protein
MEKTMRKGLQKMPMRKPPGVIMTFGGFLFGDILDCKSR